MHLLRAASRGAKYAALLAVVLVLPVSEGSLCRNCLAKLHLRGVGADAGGDRATASLQFPLCSNLQHSTWSLRRLCPESCEPVQTAAPEPSAAGGVACHGKPCETCSLFQEPRGQLMQTVAYSF